MKESLNQNEIKIQEEMKAFKITQKTLETSLLSYEKNSKGYIIIDKSIKGIKGTISTIELMQKKGLFRNGEYEIKEENLNPFELIGKINKRIYNEDILLIASNIVQNGNENGKERIYVLKEYDTNYKRLNVEDVENGSKRNVPNTDFIGSSAADPDYFYHEKNNPEKYSFLKDNYEVICNLNSIPEKELTEMKKEFENAGFYQENTKKENLTYGLSRILNVEELNADRFSYFGDYGKGIIDTKSKTPEKENLPIIKANMSENGEIRFSLLNPKEINQIKSILKKGGNKNDIIKNEILKYTEYNDEKISRLNKDREQFKQEISNSQQKISSISSSDKFTEKEKNSKIEIEKTNIKKLNELISRITQQIRNLSNMNYVVKERYKNILALDINRPVEEKIKEIGLDLRYSKIKSQSESTKKQEQKPMYAPKKNNINKKGINI